MGLDEIVTGAADVVSRVSGVARAFAKAPDSLNELPAAVVFPDNGDITYPRQANLREVRHKLKVQLFVVKGGSFAEAEARLRPFVPAVIEAIDQAVTLGGSATGAGVTRYQYGVLTYADVEYLGVTFDLTADEIQPTVFKP
jgi:hypothetical protein